MSEQVERWFPEGYDESTADAICERLADGMSLRAICGEPDMPSTSTVCKWLAKDSEFAEQYARARELQADALFDDCLDIADKGGKALEGTDERRLQIDTRKWMAGKLKGKYSDKTKHEHSGPDGAPIAFTKLEVTFVDPPVSGSS